MKLDDLKKMNIEEDSVVELCIDKPVDIKLRYFRKIVEEIPEQYREGHKEPPFIEVANGKEKHGCHQNFEEYRLDEIRWLHNHGKSASDKLHYYT
jgi:hypothetical protein